MDGGNSLEALVDFIVARVNVLADRRAVEGYVAQAREDEFWELASDAPERAVGAVLAILSAGRVRNAGPEEVAAIGVPRRFCEKTLEGFQGIARLGAAVGADLRLWPFEGRGEGAGLRLCERSNLLVYGPTGVGKTHLAAGLARRCWEAGLGVEFQSAARWLADLKAAINPREGYRGPRYSEMLRRAREVQVWVLDELILEDLSEHDATALNGVLRARYEEALPTVVTTNNNPEALHRFDVRVASRLLGEDSVLIPLGGQDRRRPVTSQAEVRERLQGKKGLA